jgi:nitrous oxidase accessory protein NosD
MKSKTLTAFTMAFAGALCLPPRPGEARTVNLACSATKTITNAVRSLSPGDTLRVSGACTERVVIPEGVHEVTIDGQGTASVTSPTVDQAAITIRGTGITLTGFTVSGGSEGILVHRNGMATITNNLIIGNRVGIALNQSSSARIADNTVQNSTTSGVSISENASARIGFISFQSGVPGGVGSNTIQNNAGNGISVSRSANAIILGNVIKGNGGDGVNVFRQGQADISSNIIETNSGDGVSVSGTSSVNLGEDTGTAIDEAANTTAAGQENGGFGVNCQLNSSMNGRLGSLTGLGGATSVGGSCNNSLIP